MASEWALIKERTCVIFCKFWNMKLIMHSNEQDGASLIRMMISKEAIFFRQQLCKAIADVLYQRMLEVIGQGIAITQHSSQWRLRSGPNNRDLSSLSRSSALTYDYQSVLRDRRLKVIFFKIFDSVRRDPVLTLRFCWASFIMFMTASALACHRILVSLSEIYLGPVSLPSKRVAISAWCFIDTLPRIPCFRANLGREDWHEKWQSRVQLDY